MVVLDRRTQHVVLMHPLRYLVYAGLDGEGLLEMYEELQTNPVVARLVLRGMPKSEGRCPLATLSSDEGGGVQSSLQPRWTSTVEEATRTNTEAHG